LEVLGLSSKINKSPLWVRGGMADASGLKPGSHGSEGSNPSEPNLNSATLEAEMSVVLQFHRIESIYLSPIQKFSIEETGREFYSHELIIVNQSHLGEFITNIQLFYNDAPAHCLTGEIVSKNLVLIDANLVE
jgi:hypothetical protein